MNIGCMRIGGTSVSAVALLVIAVLSASGCGPKLPDRGQVFGRVTHDGRPVASDPENYVECEIRFWPLEGRRPALGQLDADGNYRLSSFGQNDGAIPGKYIVTIKAVKVHLPVGGNDGWLEWIVPEKYENQETSGLTATVEPGENEINFDLPKE